MHIIQFLDKNNQQTHIGIVESENVVPLQTNKDIYQLSLDTISNKSHLKDEINKLKRLTPLNYSNLLNAGRILPPIAHPDPTHLLITGTGLTHINRVMMCNTMYNEAGLTDAQKIYQDGLDNGKPNPGKIGANHEWFFKGFGYQLKTSNEPLTIPNHALDGGEEAELAVIYIISSTGVPYRLGFTLGNEFSDHVLEKQNHYYLAQSKLRTCSIGPEIYLGSLPKEVCGSINISRNGETIWHAQYKTGPDHMTHSLGNIEHHVFKYDIFRQPGDVHVLFLGADKVSFSDQIKLHSGDKINIDADLFHCPLINTIHSQEERQHHEIKTL